MSLTPYRISGSPPVAVASLRAISALVLREMATRYGRTPGGYIWAVLEPLGMILILGYAWSLLARAPSLGTSYFLFKATGYLVLITAVMLSMQVGKSLSFSRKLLLYPRMTWVDAIAARFLLNTMVIYAVSFLILTGFLIYEDVNSVLRWRPILLAMGGAAMLGLGIGCLNAFLFGRFPVWEQLWAIATRPLFLVSGVIFTFEEAPAFAQQILWYNPVIHLTGLMREGFYPMYRPDYISLIFVALCAMIPMIAGLLLLRRYHRELLYR